MTDPADPGQLHNAISTQGATIGKHKELLRGLVEGVQTLAKCHERALDSLLEQFHRFYGRPPTMVVTPQLLSDSAASSAVSSVTPPSREPPLPPPEHFNGEPSPCQAFLAQCALVFELQLSSFPSDRSKMAFLITLMSIEGLHLRYCCVVASAGHMS